jgi:hypothetical protein
MRSLTAQAHDILAKSSPDEVRAEQARLYGVTRAAEIACNASPTEINREALRVAHEASFPYTHAVGMLRVSGR